MRHIIALALLVTVWIWASPAKAEQSRVPCKNGSSFICDENRFCGCQSQTNTFTAVRHKSELGIYQQRFGAESAYSASIVRLVDSLREVGASDREIIDIAESLGIEPRRLEIALLLPAIQK